MKIFGGFFLCLILSAVCFGQTAKISGSDLQILVGARWTGNLTYLDYGTGKKVSIPSNLTVTQSKEDKASWIFDYQYPDEPKADNRDNAAISRDGKVFSGETVVERTKLGGKSLKIVTEKNGLDNDKKALFRFTYLIGKNDFSIRKEVRYEGSDIFFVRNEYIWKR